MYKNPTQTREFFREFLPLVAGHTRDEIVVCPPYIDLCASVAAAKGSQVAVGAQNLHWEKEGAYTGEICPVMLLDVGCTHVIIGHSERRQYFVGTADRSEEHTSELQSHSDLVCRLLLEKKKKSNLEADVD